MSLYQINLHSKTTNLLINFFIMEKQTISNFANEVKPQLPLLLQNIVDQTSSDTEADMMLMGAITTISATLPNIYGIYDENVVYPNLYLFISAKASSGKGHLSLCKLLAKPIHNELRNNPLMPNQMLFMPANSSSTAMYQQLYMNNGSGLIFETEADSLNNAIKGGYGNFSDGLRKAFHHETISYLRRKENEWVEIDEPHLSIVLSGTPYQYKRLIPNTENGLFSRFAFIHLPSDFVWKNVFQNEKKSKIDFYTKQGNIIYDLYRHLRCNEQPIKFELTDTQKELFNNHFNTLQDSYKYHENFIASVRRMGVITYRVAMVLSALRLTEGMTSISKIICSDKDFNTALHISKSLLEHAYCFYNTLPESEEARKSTILKMQQKDALFQMLPTEFSRKDIINLSKTINLSPRTTDTYLKEYLTDQQIENIAFGTFRKIS